LYAAALVIAAVTAFAATVVAAATPPRCRAHRLAAACFASARRSFCSSARRAP